LLGWGKSSPDTTQLLITCTAHTERSRSKRSRNEASPSGEVSIINYQLI
jgi:hypothetical protein